LGHLSTFSIIAVSCGLVLAGCQEVSAPTQSGASATPAAATQSATVTRGKTREEVELERKVRNLDTISRNIVVSNTIQGAVVGAAVGCIFQEARGQDCKDGLVAGGLLGALGGAAVGNAAAQANRDIVKAEETLAKVKGVQKELGVIEADLRAIVRRQNSEIASLRRQVSAGQVSKSAVDARLAAINNNRAAISNGLLKANQNLATEREELVTLAAQGGQNVSGTRNAVDSTQRRIRSLRNTVQLISS